MPVNIEDRPIVMVTGFGPFLGHPVNASWEAVKLMNKDAIEKKHNIEFVSLELPVTYSNVDEFVPALWETHTPKLMIHVGVSSIAKDITLEMQARRKGYSRVDYLNNCPVNNVCTATGAVRLKTKLNVEAMCDKFNEGAPEKTHAVASRDAGIYLCEYIYYTSLSVDNERTLFVHVPDMSIYSSERTAKALERIVDLCLEQINESEKTDDVAEKLADSSINDDDDDVDLQP